MSTNTVKFTPRAVRVYLGRAIRKWRKNRDTAVCELERYMAICYIDAFQSVRISLLGKILPVRRKVDS